MEVVASSVNSSFSPRFSHNTSFSNISIPQVSQWKCYSIRVIESSYRLVLRRKKGVGFRNRDCGKEFSHGVVPSISSICYPQCGNFPSSWGFISKRRKCNSLLRLKDCSENLRQHASVLFVRLVTGVMLVMAVSLASREPSWALSEENPLFLEAWRTIDRAYIDKSFNGQSWFRYREDALRNEHNI